MLKISYAVCLGLSLTIASQFTVEMCAAAKNCEKIHQTPFLGAQGRSRSSMLTHPKSPSLVLVMICSKSVGLSICNRFHSIRANSGKITSFKWNTSLWRTRSENPLAQGHEILSLKTRVHGVAHSLHRFDTDHECDKQTDRRTPRRWLRRAKHSAVARKNCIKLNCTKTDRPKSL